jgi:serine/threonine protein kinase
MKRLATYPIDAKTIVLPKRDDDIKNTTIRQQYHRDDIIAGTYRVFDYRETPSGESEVYFCLKGNQKVAVKLYFEGHEGELESREKIAQIDSKYVMKILDSGTVDGRYYEVLPYYKNGSLIDKLELLKESYVLDTIIPCINEGLHAIHEQGLIHRDIKPHNIFLSDDLSFVVIGDFGVVRTLQDQAYVINKSPLSIRYNAPEAGLGGISSKASDYYSFGMTILDLLFGKDLYVQIQDQDMERNMAYYGVRIPRDISLDVRDLIAALIHTSPMKRATYMDIQAWLEDSTYFHGLSVYYDQDDTQSIRPFAIDGTYYHTLSSLARALNNNWETALSFMADDLLLPHLRHTHKERYLRLKKILSYTKDLTVKTAVTLSMMTQDTIILYQGNDYQFDDFIVKTRNIYTSNKAKQASPMIETLTILYWQQSTNTILQTLLYDLMMSEHPHKQDWIVTLLSKGDIILYRHKNYPEYKDLVYRLIEDRCTINEPLFSMLQEPLFTRVMTFQYDTFVPLIVEQNPVETTMRYQFEVTGSLPLYIGSQTYQSIQDVFHTIKESFEQKERFTNTNLIMFLVEELFMTYLRLHLEKDFGPKKIHRILTMFEQYESPTSNPQYRIAYLIYLYFTNGEYFYLKKHNIAVETIEELLEILAIQTDLETISTHLLDDWMFQYWMDKKEQLHYVLGESK